MGLLGLPAVGPLPVIPPTPAAVPTSPLNASPTTASAMAPTMGDAQQQQHQLAQMQQTQQLQQLVSLQEQISAQYRQQQRQLARLQRKLQAAARPSLSMPSDDEASDSSLPPNSSLYKR
eukprot:TRINITY_DN23557_c0_g1_i1.p1 TRINITY_DN23557_c0_g1~~TRINITY_DN23557_c0_g1_i1.p1  ORF type:complete len:119 (+),score=29.22 TRINITY_DN23557_c0_g1_i1:2-358(+)